MAKPFSIQAPENIAKEYAGNKQKIAQAAQMGIVDPTAAVLAGMFIDRMRSAQVMEAGQQQPTVAQQVLGGQPPQGAPPPPMGAPPAPAQGMGAPPQQMPMAPPPQDMGMAPPPQGMAMGGIASLPVPDAMFDEPTNGGYDDGYAGGGMVAFADGGSTGGLGDFIEQTVRKLDPNIQIAGRARTPARNAEVGGVASSYHLIDAARDISVPPGMAKPQFIAQLKSVFGPDYDILPSKGNSVHIEPGPKLGEKVRAGAGSIPIPERDLSTAQGRAISLEDYAPVARRLMARSPEQEAMREEARASFEDMRSPERYEKERKDAMYMTLAEIGFNMASSKSPYVLQAIGEAAKAALPGARVDKKERKALKDRALAGLMQLGAEDEKMARDALALTVDMANSGMQAEQFEKKLSLEETNANRQYNLEVMKYNDLKARAAASNISFDELLAAQVMSGAITPAMEKALKLRRGGEEGGGGPFEKPLDPKEKQNPAYRYQ